MKKRVVVLLMLLAASICLNLFQWRNQAITCDNIDSKRKVDLLYFLGHKNLDADKDGIPCEENIYK